MITNEHCVCGGGGEGEGWRDQSSIVCMIIMYVKECVYASVCLCN